MLIQLQGFAAQRNVGWDRRRSQAVNTVLAGMVMAMLLLTACGVSPNVIAAPSGPYPDRPPPLPFDDNPDPTLCGIPTEDNRRGIAHGQFEGELVTPIIYLYESHVRQTITGQIFPDTEVRIRLSQSNPTLDYYFVQTVNVEPPQEGWIPAPFVTVK